MSADWRKPASSRRGLAALGLARREIARELAHGVDVDVDDQYVFRDAHGVDEALGRIDAARLGAEPVPELVEIGYGGWDADGAEATGWWKLLVVPFLRGAGEIHADDRHRILHVAACDRVRIGPSQREPDRGVEDDVR